MLGLLGSTLFPLTLERIAPPPTVSVAGPETDTPTRLVATVFVSRTRALTVVGSTRPATPNALGAADVLARRRLLFGADVPVRSRLLAYSVFGFSGTIRWVAVSQRT